MKVVTRYEAYDGTLFEDENECGIYERKKKTESGGFRLYSSKGEKLPTSDTDSYYMAGIIVIESEAGAKLADEMFCDIGIYTDPFKVGTWVWDEDQDEWYRPEDRVARYTQEVTRLAKLTAE